MSKKAIAFACAAGLALAGATAIRPALADAPSVKDIMKNYGDLAEAMYSDSLAKAKDLDKAIDAFLANPNATTQKAAQDAFLTCKRKGSASAIRLSMIGKGTSIRGRSMKA
jgi:putative iron-regulated protein